MEFTVVNAWIPNALSKKQVHFYRFQIDCVPETSLKIGISTVSSQFEFLSSQNLRKAYSGFMSTKPNSISTKSSKDKSRTSPEYTVRAVKLTVYSY